MAGKAKFRFSFGPWNIHEGADVFGPAARKPDSRKLEELGSVETTRTWSCSSSRA